MWKTLARAKENYTEAILRRLALGGKTVKRYRKSTQAMAKRSRKLPQFSTCFCV